MCAPGVSGTHKRRVVVARDGERAARVDRHFVELPAIAGMRHGHRDAGERAHLQDDLEPIAIDLHARRGDLGAVRRAGGRGGQPLS